MSEQLKLSKVLGLEYKNCPVMLPDTREFRNGKEHGHDEALKKLDQRSPDFVKLAKVLFAREMKIIGDTSFGWKDLTAREQKSYLDEAQEIINKMSVWVVKESSGQCNHEFMQQYDFSKFSNAGNSLKCVKCGLIKKG